MEPKDIQEDDILDRATRALRETPVQEEMPPEEINKLIAASMTALQQASHDGDDRTISKNPTQPAIRLVPDVPTELADGVPRETHRIERPPNRRHMPGRIVTMLHKRSIRWSVAAAVAASVVLTIGFWPGKPGRGSGNGVVWADVVRNISEAKTMVCWGGHGETRHRYRLMSKGSLSRLEDYGPGTELQPRGERKPIRITLSPPTNTSWDKLEWSPSRKRVWRYTTRGCQPSLPMSLGASAIWADLQRITADQARQVGEAHINGVQALIFEASADSFFGAQTSAPKMEGTVRVWVSKEAAVPVQMEFRHGGVESFVEMEWDLPLSDELFQVPTFDDSWKVKGHHKWCYEDSFWRSGLKLAISPSGGPAIITEKDIKGIRASLVTDTTKTGQALTATFDLTDEAWRILQDYKKANAGQQFSVTLNGQAPIKLKDTSQSYSQQQDTEPLNLSPEDFEGRYLKPISLDQAKKKAQQIFETLRTADYKKYRGAEWTSFPKIDYEVRMGVPMWIEWMVKTFSANPIKTFELAEVRVDSDGLPIVSYKLLLANGVTLEDSLRFKYHAGRFGGWYAYEGLDWHLKYKNGLPDEIRK